MRLTRAAFLAAGGLVLACTEHVATEPRIDQPLAALAVTASAPGKGRFEPVGYAVATERDFATKARSARDATGAEGWDATESRYAALSIAADATAPRSAPSVMKITIRRGTRGGALLGRSSTALPTSTRQLYASLWIKLSDSWRGGGALAELSITGTRRLTIGLAAAASGAPTVVAAVAAPGVGSRPVPSTAVPLTRGAWHRVELVAKTNTPGAADGLLDLWIDGAPVVSTSSLTYAGKGESDVWDQLALAPTWGAMADRASQDMYMSWDHVYVSGSSSTSAPTFANTTALAAPAAADNAVFSDGFESGTLSAWQDGVNATKQQVLNDSTLAHSGTHVLQLSYPAGGGGGWLTRFFMPGLDSLYVSYWLRLDPSWVGPTALLTVRGSRTDNQWSSFGKAGVCPSGSDFFATGVAVGSASNPLDLSFATYYPGMPRGVDGVSCWPVGQGTGSATYAGNRSLTTGTWHHVELWVKLNTVGQSDAVQRIWLDGQLAGEWTGLALRGDTALELNSLMLDAAASVPQAERLYIDDVNVLPAMPGTTPPPPAPVASIAVTLNAQSLSVGQSTQAVAVPRDADGNALSGRAVSWSSSNTAVASVDTTGLVTAVAAGSATITATSEGVTGSAAMTVVPPPVAAVSVTLNSPSLTTGQGTQAVATLRDAGGTVLTGRTTTWSSSNTAVATVNATGFVSSVGAGTTTITATSEGVSGGASLTVVAPPPPADNVIFQDDFESGSLAAWQDGVDPTKHQVLNDPTLAHSGSHVLQMTFPAGGTGGWLTRFFMPGYDGIHVSYWIRLQPNWQGSANLLIIRGSRTDNQWSSYGKAGVCPNGSDFFATSMATGLLGSDQLDMSFYTYYPAMAREADGVTCYGRVNGTGTTTYNANRRLTAGIWHKIEFEVKLNTVGQNDARQRLWMDGALIGDWSGFAFRADSVLRLNSFTLDGHGTPSQTEKLYIDDVQITALAATTPPPPPAPVASVGVTLNSASLNIGEATQAVAVTRDASGNVLSGRLLNWSSSNTGVATVDASGLVHAVGAGSASITATSEGVTGLATVTVTAPPPPTPVASVSVVLNSSTLVPGENTQATATLRDASGNVLSGRTIAWTSSATSIATVSALGLVGAVAPGSVTITATSEGVSGTATLTVTPVPVASVTVTLNAASLTIGQNTQAVAVLKDASGNVLTGRTITWSSSNGGVASVSATGSVTALTAGTSNIVATSEGKAGSAPLAVSAPPAPVASVSVALGSSSLSPGQTTQATAVLRDATGNVLTGRTITWSSSNLAVASVNGNGVITALAAGSATIRGVSEGVTGSADMSVVALPPPPPSGEPQLQATDLLLYSDGFEGFADKTALLTYNFSLDRYTYSGSENIGFPSPAGGHTGSKAVRINYPVSVSYQDQGALISAERVPNIPLAPVQFMIVEGWVRTIPGYPCQRRNAADQQSAGEKTLIWNQGATAGPRFVLSCGDKPSGTWYNHAYDSSFPSGPGFVLSADGPVGGTGTFWYFQNMNAATRSPMQFYNDGNWHLLKVKLTPGTFQNSTGGNGSVEMWADGVKVMEYIGSDPSRPEYNQVLVPTSVAATFKNFVIGGPFNGGPSPAQGPQWKDYDDVKIWVRP